MQNEDLIREIATRACREALLEKSQGLAEAVSSRMLVALASESSQPPRTKELRDGTILIASSRTQTEALETLLTASAAIAPDCGLMILRGAQAVGWSCHRITTLENFKRITLDCTGGVVAKVVSSCTGVMSEGSELDPAFLAKLRLEKSARILLVPVLLKERVAALLVAVSQQSDDLAGLELLVQVAQLTLDMQAYRKASPQPVVQPSQPVVQHRPTAPSAQVQQREESAYTTAVTDTATEAHGMTTPSIHPARVYATSMTANVVEEQRAVPAFHESETHSPSPSPVLDEAHEKARRFAKLLVEEIKLYNQTKVAEGRARGDLYSRLREDIEKSRAAYHKRYGERVRDIDYFAQELMRILADNHPSVMGAGFPG